MAIGAFAGLSMFTRELIPVIALGTVSIAILLSQMRVPWRHRHVSAAARRIAWVGIGLGVLVITRIAVVVLGA